MTPIDLRKFIERIATLSNILPERFFEIVKEVNGDPLAVAEAVVKRRWVEREQAGMIFGDIIGKTYLDLSTTLFQPEAVELLPKEFAERYKAIPVYKFGDAVTVAVAKPYDTETIKAIKAFMPCPVDTVMSFSDEINTAIKLNYDVSDTINVEDLNTELKAISKMSDDSLANYKPVVELADKLLMLAIKQGVSDIHVEPKEAYCSIRFRDDGVLKEKVVLNVNLGTALVARLKVMAKMDITEKRKPQDGRIKFQTPVKDIDVRVNSLPVIYGEKVVLRLLGSLGKDVPLNLERLGVSGYALRPFKKVLEEPNGIILVTGPTGSGKTTTLYASLNYIDKPDHNITTIEDPVEYVIPSFNQSNVDQKAGRKFTDILRAILRQDPDVILVGEIRDGETAAIATQAALTGHLVLSSLHTNSALQAITRLTDMGVPSHILAPAIKGVVAQRLVRKLCEYCKEAVDPLTTEYISTYLELDVEDLSQVPRIYEARGCKHCHHTGFSGRVGIHEVLVVDGQLQELIMGNQPSADIRRYAYENGFVDMKLDGFTKVMQGVTTFEEVVRVTSQL